MIYFEDTVPCEICGKRHPARFMEEIFTGRVHYICTRCYLNGLRKAEDEEEEESDGDI